MRNKKTHSILFSINKIFDIWYELGFVLGKIWLSRYIMEYWLNPIMYMWKWLLPKSIWVWYVWIEKSWYLFSFTYSWFWSITDNDDKMHFGGRYFITWYTKDFPITSCIIGFLQNDIFGRAKFEEGFTDEKETHKNKWCFSNIESKKSDINSILYILFLKYPFHNKFIGI